MIATSVWGGERQRKALPVEQSTIIVAGYPRNDIFFNYHDDNLTNLKEKNNLNDYFITKWQPIYCCISKVKSL